MDFDISLADFLARNRIARSTWESADIAWELLCAIATDHLARKTELSETAEFCGRAIQKLPRVHSVRWRVKDAEHVLEKIVRKRALGGENNKYLTIGFENYHEIVTDLVGLRALHLFKDECFEIDASLRESFILLEGEDPVAYLREGDPIELIERFQEAGLKVQRHKAGYRSVHYVVGSQPLLRRVAAEVQVRTIFEEGWSEIDHRVRYPNFSHDPQIAYFLRIFNGLAGSADEMGSFVRGLVQSLDENQRQITEANESYEATLRKLEETVAELASVREISESAQAGVDKLKRELADLRATSKQAASARARPTAELSLAALARQGIGGSAIFENADLSHTAAAAFRNLDLGHTAGVTLKNLDLGDSAAAAFRSLDVGHTAGVTLKNLDLGDSAAAAFRSLDVGHTAGVILKNLDFGDTAAAAFRNLDVGHTAGVALKNLDLGLTATEALKNADLGHTVAEAFKSTDLGLTTAKALKVDGSEPA